jgi:hypothetical protein
VVAVYWKCSFERRISWNGGPACCRSDSCARNHDGSRTARWRLARSQRSLSAARLVPISNRAPEYGGDCTDDDSFFSRSCASKNSGQARQGLLCTGHSPRSARSLHRTCRAIHPAVCRHARFAGKAPNHEIQAVDAKRPGALVGRAVTWHSDVHALVRARFSAQINAACLTPRRMLEIHPGLAAHHLERRRSG